MTSDTKTNLEKKNVKRRNTGSNLCQQPSKEAIK